MPDLKNLSDEELKREFFKEAANSIEFFAESVLAHMLTANIPTFHKEIYGLLPINKRLVIAAPRGFAKSYLCSVIYPIWIGCFAPCKEVVIISASETLAREMLRKIKREFESNVVLRGFFGDLITDKWSETHAVLKTGVNFRARGSEGQIRGFRPECIILDDLETDESVASEDQRRKIHNWIMRACLPALTPQGQLLLIGSILSPLAVLKQIIDSDNRWVKRVYKAYIDGNEAAGHELWENLWPHPKLQQRKREIGSYAFAAEYMNDPMSNEAASIKPESIRRWKELPTQLSCVIAVDPAYSEEEKADWKVASLIGIDQQMNRYLISYIRTHCPQGEFIDATLNMWQSNKATVTALGVPSAGLESEIFRSFTNKATARKLYPPFVELKNTFVTQSGVSKKGKGARIIAALQPLFEQGKYYIGESHDEAFNELVSLNPSMNQRWDDLIDTLAYAEQIIQPVFLGDEKKFEEAIPKIPNNYGYE